MALDTPTAAEFEPLIGQSLSVEFCNDRIAPSSADTQQSRFENRFSNAT